MKEIYIFLITLFLIFTLFLPNLPAQDYNQWGLPEGATTRIGKGMITSNIAYSPDGTLLAVASTVGIWIYDAQTGIELNLLIEPTKIPISSICFSPDGTTLAAANKFDVYLWDTLTWKYKTTLMESSENIFFPASSIIYSPDGTTLATTDGTKAHLWDAVTGRHKVPLKNDSDVVNSITYSPDGKTIATAGSTKAHLWDVVTGKHKATLKWQHTNTINSIAYSPDGKTIATAGADKKVCFWDAATGKHKATVDGYTHPINYVVYSPDGITLAVASGNRLHLYHASTRKNKNTLKGRLYGLSGYFDSVAYSPDGKTIATASKDEVRLWNAGTGKHIVTLKDYTFSTDYVAYSSDGKTIATATASPHYRHSLNSVVLLWDALTGEHRKDCIVNEKEYFSLVRSLTYSPDAKTVATAIGDKVYFWDVDTGKHHEIILKEPTNSSVISFVTYSPDGKTIATATLNFAGEDQVLLWDVDTGKHKSTLKLPSSKLAIPFVVYSADGKMIATADRSEVHLWDADIGKHKSTLKGHTQNVTFVAYSPDGKTIITASRMGEGEVRFWDADTGTPEGTLKGYWSLVYSPDGETVAAASTTGEMHLWDADLKKHKTILKHHSRWTTPAYSPDGKTLATVSSDGTVLLWDTRVLASQISRQPSTLIQQVSTPQTPQQIAKKALGSTVLVVMENANGQPLSSGSGFFIERGMIATNLHVVEGVFKGYIKRVGMDRTHRIEGIVAMDSRQDLAIIKVSDVNAPILSLGRSDKVQVGEPVYVAGNPIGFLEGTFSDGIVSGIREFKVGSERIQITAPISKGSSGGPVLNNKGEVIGIAVSTITAGQNLNFAIPTNYLKKLLQDLRSFEKN